jgi:hypothetical protein
VPRSLLLFAPLAAIVCAGCTIPDWDITKAKPIDQATFAPAARGPGQAEMAAAHLPPLPLLTILMDESTTDWRSSLPAAVDAARSRKPEVEFDVMAPIPTASPPDVQDRAARQGEADVRDVAHALAEAGVVPDRIHPGFTGDPGNPPREVLVYVR